MKIVLKVFFVLLIFTSTVYSDLYKKSAIFYYGKAISYPMVGIHDYIFVEPKNTNIYTHGFSLYKNKIYAHINLDGEYAVVLKKIDSLLNKGYENLYLEDKNFTPKTLIDILKWIHSKYPKIKVALNTSENNLAQVYKYLEIIVVKKLSYTHLAKLKSYGIDIVDIEFKSLHDKEKIEEKMKELIDRGVIPYITSRYNDYGYSSKKAIKREILTLIDESGDDDRMTLGAHQYGALPLEYLGYIQKLYDASKGLPNIEDLNHYAGVVIWLDKEYTKPIEIIKFVKELEKKEIKVVFVNNFGARVDNYLLKQLGIDIFDSDASSESKKTIVQRDDMIGFEAEPLLSASTLYFLPENSKPLYTYEDNHKFRSIPAAITPWGGYVMGEAFMVEFHDKNIWIINPFKLFQEALRLKPLVIPDPTTENGNRLLFTHVDGDGIMNVVESNPELFSGDVLLEKILKPFKIPHSISVIGAEIDPDGLYPKLSKRLSKIVKDMYALPNVEAATHTFTHPFYWGKIKNGFLPLKYRLKVKNYNFSYDREIKQCLSDINTKHLPKMKAKANTVFWSGDCSPRENTLEYIYKNNILNINGGDTTISNANPWLTEIAPLGLERGEYYQIFTGAQNENVFTNDWLGPFWGFKRVVQTFKLTNSPRRLKPIDVYYHIYSGSKTASLNALKYIFKWVIKQDVMPIYTSAYIPKAMDYFTVSMANEGDEWLIAGMRDLKTLRIEKKDASIDLKKSKTALGIKHFENHTYISLDNSQNHYIKVSNNQNYKKSSYLISSNAKIVDFKNGIKNKRMTFDGEVDLKLNYNIPNGCRIKSVPKEDKLTIKNQSYILEYKNIKKAIVTIYCK